MVKPLFQAFEHEFLEVNLLSHILLRYSELVGMFYDSQCKDEKTRHRPRQAQDGAEAG